MKRSPNGFVREMPLADEAATKLLGERIAAALRPGDALALAGDLGVGKTTLARAVLQALGVKEHVPSPTFTLVQHYETPRLPIDHFDLYRFETEAEIEQLGLEDALLTGAALIEWPERAGSSLPPDCLRVEMTIVNPGRRASISGSAEWASRLFESSPNVS